MAVPLGLLAAVTWGLSTFLASRLARGIPAVALTFWTQLLGLLPLVSLALLLDGPGIEALQLKLGILAGLGVGVSLLLLYLSFMHVIVGISSAVAGSVGTIGPVVFSMAVGVPPSSLAMTGIFVSVCAIVVLTLAPRDRRAAVRTRLMPAAVPETAASSPAMNERSPRSRHLLGVIQASSSGLMMSVYYVALSGLSGGVTFWVLAALEGRCRPRRFHHVCGTRAHREARARASAADGHRGHDHSHGSNLLRSGTASRRTHDRGRAHHLVVARGRRCAGVDDLEGATFQDAGRGAGGGSSGGRGCRERMTCADSGPPMRSSR